MIQPDRIPISTYSRPSASTPPVISSWASLLRRHQRASVRAFGAEDPMVRLQGGLVSFRPEWIFMILRILVTTRRQCGTLKQPIHPFFGLYRKLRQFLLVHPLRATQLGSDEFDSTLNHLQMKLVRHINVLKAACVLTILLTEQSYAQIIGNEPYFLLSNYPSRARISYADGQPAGPEIYGQLYFGALEDPPDKFMPLFPITPITSEPGLEGYLKGVLVFMPVGYFGGETIAVQLRAFDGESWESSTIRGESITLDRKLIDSTHGPNRLTGLQPFSVHTVPEPSTWSILVVGFVATMAMTCRLRRKY